VIGCDWGGKEGETLYPTRNLNTQLLDGRTEDDLRIRKGDDLRILQETIVLTYGDFCKITLMLASEKCHSPLNNVRYRTQ